MKDKTFNMHKLKSSSPAGGETAGVKWAARGAAAREETQRGGKEEEEERGGDSAAWGPRADDEECRTTRRGVCHCLHMCVHYHVCVMFRRIRRQRKEEFCIHFIYSTGVSLCQRCSWAELNLVSVFLWMRDRSQSERESFRWRETEFIFALVCVQWWMSKWSWIKLWNKIWKDGSCTQRKQGGNLKGSEWGSRF